MRARLFLSQSPTLTLFPYLLWLRGIVVCTALVSGLLSSAPEGYWLVLLAYLALIPICLRFKPHLSGLHASSILLCLDVLALSYFIYANQGVISGWVSALLLPAVLSSLALPRLMAWTITLVSMLCYALLIAIYLLPTASSHMHMHSNNMADHMLGMLITFWVSAFLITAFITAQARIVRQQHQQLLQQQQRQFRDEQIMAVATLTANTAHHLATPLSSASMLLDELAELPQAEQAQQIQIIQQQITRCQQALTKVIEQGKQFDPLNWQLHRVDTWLKRLSDNWWLTHNEIRFSCDIDPTLHAYQLRCNDSLELAITSMLDNAARACQNHTDGEIRLTAIIDNQQLLVSIRDNGEGIDAQLEQQLGKAFVQSKGNGIGLALANASIEQAGGKVSIENLAGGVAVHLSLPITKSDNE